MLKEAAVRHRGTVLSLSMALALVALNGPAVQPRAQANRVQTNEITDAKALPWGGATRLRSQPSRAHPESTST